MRCDEVRELLPGYVDSEGHPAGDVEGHLAGCAGCRRELEAYRATLAELAVLADADPMPSPALAARAIAAIPERTLSERILSSVREHPRAYAVAVAGTALAATAVALAVRRSRADGGGTVAATA